MRRLLLFLPLLLVLTVVPYGRLSPGPVARAAQAEPPALAQDALPEYAEQEVAGGSSNDEPGSAEPIGAPAGPGWSQTIKGAIGSSTDVDYFKLNVTGPGATIKITMSGPSADYDLVLGGGADTSQGADGGDFLPGLEEVTEIGGRISSIGGRISSIGGRISSIGGRISSIGGRISSIGGSVTEVSANANTSSEEIDTTLWLPGEYYVVVTTANGEFSATQPYSLSIELVASGLTSPPPSPEVSVRIPTTFLPETADQITTLYISYPGRFEELYPGSVSTVSLIRSNLNNIASRNLPINNAPAEYGVVIDLGQLRPIVGRTSTISDVFNLWEANQDNPLYANYVAGMIDNVIESAITAQPSGSDPAYIYQPGSGTEPVLPLPNIRNVVLVGGDEIIPFYRLPDLTEIANEAEYADYMAQLDPSGIIGTDTPLGAALRNRMLLTDSPYGSDKPYRFYGFPFYLPRLAVGRLVETPEEILDYLDFYSRGSEADFEIDATAYGQPDPPLRRAFVSGYDFLTDQAQVVGATLRATGLQPEELNFLANDSWGRAEVEQEWFDRALESEFPVPPSLFVNGQANIDLSSVNAHFDHWQLLPAVNPSGSADGNFPALRMLEPEYAVPLEDPLYFGGTLGYSVGCHSGYNVIAASVADIPGSATYAADFPQAQNAHGGNWVGNTGYGYGTADGVDYSERLAVLYTQELARAVLDDTGTFTIGATIGDALVNAKQRYVRNAASLSPYDYKVINITTLYGLPFVRVLVSRPLAPPEEDPSPNRPNVPLETRAPVLPNAGTGRLSRTITFTIDVDANDFRDVARTGSQIYELDPADFTVVDEFDQRGDFPTQAVRVFNNNQAGVPTLPTYAYDISALNRAGTARLKVLDVVFVSGSYGNRQGFNPQITQIVTETDTPIVNTPIEPNYAVGAGFWYPDKFFGFSSVGEEELQRDQLTSFAAQFFGDQNGVTGLLRPYGQMVFQVLYDDPSVSSPAADALDADISAPIIESVRIQSPGGQITAAQAGQALIVVRASDAGADADGVDRNQGIAEVSAIYVTDGFTWEQVTFRETAPGSGIFTATVPTSPGYARFIVRATDVAGNSSYYTAKGQFTPISLVSLPMVIR